MPIEPVITQDNKEITECLLVVKIVKEDNMGDFRHRPYCDMIHETEFICGGKTLYKCGLAQGWACLYQGRRFCQQTERRVSLTEITK